MKIAGAVFGLVVLAVVFVVWIRAYRAIKGDDEPLFSWGHRKRRAPNNSLDEFIASYKRGSPAGDIPAAARPPALPGDAAPPASAAAPARREAFLSGPTKVAYYVCKTGLRDHHVFAHVRLSALSGRGTINPAVAHAGVDLLICNAGMSPVAAIDLIGAEKNAVDAAKSDHLKLLGIRYLRFSEKSLPRPDQLRGMLYRL
jgi:hypothetical protein